MFIAVDLKAIEVHVPMVARAAGVADDRVLAGLVRLWHRCWSTSSDRLTATELAGLFGGDRIEALTEALCVEFLERSSDGFRARGAARYLRLRASFRDGARKTNEGRLKGDALRRRPKASAYSDALSPNTEHRTPNTEVDYIAPVKPAPAPRESDALCQDFLEATGATYVWQGAKDGTALARLRKAASLDEVRQRWREGLRATGWLQVRTVAQLASKWNDLASPSTGDTRAPAPVADWSGQTATEFVFGSLEEDAP